MLDINNKIEENADTDYPIVRLYLHLDDLAFRRKTGPWTTARGTLISCGHSTYHKLLPLTWWSLGKGEV